MSSLVSDNRISSQPSRSTNGADPASTGVQRLQSAVSSVTNTEGSQALVSSRPAFGNSADPAEPGVSEFLGSSSQATVLGVGRQGALIPNQAPPTTASEAADFRQSQIDATNGNDSLRRTRARIDALRQMDNREGDLNPERGLVVSSGYIDAGSAGYRDRNEALRFSRNGNVDYEQRLGDPGETIQITRYRQEGREFNYEYGVEGESTSRRSIATQGDGTAVFRR